MGRKTGLRKKPVRNRLPDRPGALGGWWADKLPVLRVVGITGGLLGLYLLLSLTQFWRDHVLIPYLAFYARLSGWVLAWIGQPNQVAGSAIMGSDFSLSIQRGCDALEPTALFVAAVVAFPVPLRQKAWALLLGPLALAVLNLFRIVSLFLIRAYWPSTFAVMHNDVWQMLFIACSVLLLTLWLRSVTRMGQSSEA